MTRSNDGVTAAGLFLLLIAGAPGCTTTTTPPPSPPRSGLDVPVREDPFADVLRAPPAGNPLDRGAGLRPDFAGARLRTGGQALPPVSLVAPAPEPGIPAGNLTLHISEGTITARRPDGAAAWTAAIEGADGIGTMGVEGGVLFCQGWQRMVDVRGYESWSPLSAGTVLRLDLDSGTWAEPLDLRFPVESRERIRDFLAGPEGTAVLTAVSSEDFQLHERNITSYRVSFFLHGVTRPAWSKERPSAGALAGPTAFRMGEDKRLSSEIHSLSFAQRDLVVCAGPREDVIGFDRDSGSERWKVERLWEFRRCFAGPSIWAYFIRRKEPAPVAPSRKKGESEEEDGEARVPERILGGPFVVATGMGDGEYDSDPFGSGDAPRPGYRVFVVVSRDQGERWLPGYLLEASVYEINDGGHPIAVVPLPRPVIGGTSRALPDGVLWFHPSHAVSKVVPSVQRESMGMGDSGGTDHVARIAWYREPGAIANPRSWIAAATAGRVEFVGADTYLYQAAGGYILKPDEKVYRFPFVRLDLGTGQETTMILEVPFTAEAPAPEEFAGMTTIPGAGTYYQLREPYLLAVTDLDVTGKRVRITLWEAGNTYSALEFEL